MDDVILMADPKSNSWKFAKKIKNYIKEKKGLDIPLKETIFDHFRNQEIEVYIPENIRKKNIYFIHDSTKNPQEWWVELLLLKDAAFRASAESLSFVLPDMFYSRQDRKEKPHVPISARALADSISKGLKRIITMDLHAPQIQGFYPENVPLDNLYSFPAVANYLKNSKISNLEELVVVSPDAGGVDRAKAFANRLNSKYPVAFAYKRRELKGGREIKEMIFVGEVYDKSVFVVDDILDSGGTLCKAAEVLRKKGAKNLYCYATHGLFTKGIENICKNFEKVMVSNTHDQTYKGIEIIDVSPVFAEAIYRAQKGESISQLFK